MRATLNSNPLYFPPKLIRQNNVMLNFQLFKVDEPSPKNPKYHDQVGVVPKLIWVFIQFVFSCSPTSTNWIYTSKFVFISKSTEESTKIGLKKQTSQLWLSKVHV